MFTVCPKCTLTLALTTADLRMGQGYVRCGRCANVFNALLSLSEEPAEERDAVPASRSPPPHLQTEQSSDGGIENESNYAEGTGTFETIVLEGDAITQTEEYVPEASVDSEIAALTERLGITAHDAPLPPGADAALERLTPSDPVATLQPVTASTALPAWPWTAGSMLLLLLLLAQGVHHWRERIAASPFWGAPLIRAYTAMGLPLHPNWNLAAYDVRQLGATSDPSDTQLIQVRLSLVNHAAGAQPLPLLRLTLLDRYGKPLSQRELTPEEYWPPGSAPPAFLGHEQRVDSQITVRDPSAASASFELDVCLRENSGELRCASDAAPPLAPVIGTATP